MHTLELLERLARAGEFEFVGLAHREPRPAARLRAAGVAIEWQRAPLGVVWQQLVLPRRLAAGDLDLFWSPLQTLPGRLPIPAIATIHDLAVLLYPETLPLRVRWSQIPFLATTVDRATRLIAVSRATADDLVAAFPAAAGKVEVIANGVDAAWRPGEAPAIAATREALGAPGGYLLSVGTLEPRKNLDLLLDAWLLLRDELGEATPPLLLSGSPGWKSRALDARLAALAPLGVRRLGRLPLADLRAAVQAATVFVYPSLYEGFGLPVLEAMACAVPVVVSRTPALLEVTGDAGCAIEPDDPAGLAAELAALLADPRRAAAFGQRGRERSLDLSWDAAAQRLGELFRAVLAEGRA